MYKNVNGILVLLTQVEVDAVLAERGANQIVYDSEQAKINQRAQDFIDNLPTWSAVCTAIDHIESMADAQIMLKK